MSLSRGSGWVLCCACFKAHTEPYPDLYVDAEGQKWDFCKTCSGLVLNLEKVVPTSLVASANLHGRVSKQPARRPNPLADLSALVLDGYDEAWNDLLLHIVAGAIARTMDDNSDSDGSWRGADICAALHEFIETNHGWKNCPDHGVYSVNQIECPQCMKESF